MTLPPINSHLTKQNKMILFALGAKKGRLMHFYPHFAREDYNPKTGDYIPMWQKYARAHHGIKLSSAECNLTSFGQYSPAYPTTNEDWRFAMHELNPAGKSILTVTGSGDQPIAFVISGAHDVDTFDTTYFAKVIMDMKTSAIQTMTHNQYDAFVRQLRDTKFAPEIPGYEKITTVCPKSSIIATKQMKGCHIFKQGAGIRPEYLPDDNEYILAKKFVTGPINFIWSDLQNLYTQLNKEYDIVYLSNIFEYFHKQTQITDVLNSLHPFIKNGGKVMLYTSWVQTNTSEQIEAAAHACGWGKTQSHNKQNAFMLTMQRMR